MNKNPYKLLAERLDALPNGFPPTDDGAELRLLEKLFTLEEAELASHLRLTLEKPEQIAARAGKDDLRSVYQTLKVMSKKGLIKAGRADKGMGFRIMPFVVGIYEMQAGRIDSELAKLVEDYYHMAFGQILSTRPHVHRVIPINKSIKAGMEVRPFESAVEIIADARSWGVVECICRKQKELIGDPCQHPLDVCLVFNQRPGAFEGSTIVHSLTREEAEATLRQAADEGLVHSVSNNQEGLWYICNCCTCSCGILRGMAELGIANTIARSAFCNQVDEDKCTGCGLCVDECQFGALIVNDIAAVNQTRCTGCGVCVQACPDDALSLFRRPDEEILDTPVTEMDWMVERSKSRKLPIEQVL